MCSNAKIPYYHSLCFESPVSRKPSVSQVSLAERARLFVCPSTDPVAVAILPGSFPRITVMCEYANHRTSSQPGMIRITIRMQEFFEISLTWGDRTLFDIFVNIFKKNGGTDLKKNALKYLIKVYQHDRFLRDPDHDPDLRADLHI
jgi:hypothetical protein